MTNVLLVAVDFDGTVVTHEYPRINYKKDIGSVRVLKRFVKEGSALILNTMRSGETLSEAVKWFEDRGISLWGINENPTQKEWTSSPKVYAHLYIDDAAACIPLVKEIGYRDYVDWIKLEKWLESENYLHPYSKNL
ncbi:MAG: hypothetical protein FWF12_00890 [Betaproteobacteria bacterium]|nr:hypothetical protein [Betaproteobacteria bacterium]